MEEVDYLRRVRECAFLRRRKQFTLKESTVNTPPIEYATTGVTMGRYQRP